MQKSNEKNKRTPTPTSPLLITHSRIDFSTMTLTRLDAMRKYSIEVSVDDMLDQLHQQLTHLHSSSEIHANKRKKIVIQLERKSNQLRRSIDPTDESKQRKIVDTTNLIRRIKKQIIAEEYRERQRRMNEQDNLETSRWFLGTLAVTVGAVVAATITMATLILIMLEHSNERKI